MPVEFTPKHFKPAEIEGLKGELVAKIDFAREVSGVPYIINSGFRTPEHNKEIGGAPDSAHLKGLAVDISAKDKKTRSMIVYGLLYAGFQRIKIYKTHIHADLDNKKTHPWLGIEKE